jgi:HAD domain in Swiss Army Knife RNA repair proteins
MKRPLLLIDVDGVISLYGPDQTRIDQMVATMVDGIPHLLSRRAAAALRGLVADFECVWCTGWEERADEHLPELLGLPRGWPHIRFPDRPELAAHWKLTGIDGYAGPERPLAWIDDAHDPSCHDWARQRSAPTLLVATEPAVGLTEEHAAELRRWAVNLR